MAFSSEEYISKQFIQHKYQLCNLNGDTYVILSAQSLALRVQNSEPIIVFSA